MRTTEHSLLADDLILPKRDIGFVSQRQLRVANELAAVTEHSGTFRLRRKRGMVGFARLGSAIVTVRPDIPTRTFVALVYIFNNIPLEEAGGIDLYQEDVTSELFRGALAMGLIRAVESVSRRHIDQSYENHRERLQLLRGRPLWRRDFGRVRDGSIECEFALKTTDSLLNRLLLAGLLEARKCMPTGISLRPLRHQIATWEGLATPMVVIERHDFSEAFRRLTRQTEAYGSALMLCEALLFGIGDPHDRLEGHIPMPIYDLGRMFEKLVQRIVIAVADDYGRQASTQETIKEVLYDCTGEEYRRIRPDAVVKDDGKPVAIIDAKYKPRYTYKDSGNKRSYYVERGDIFQLFFYADRLRDQSEVEHPIPAFVAAPHLSEDLPMPSREERTIYWEDNAKGHIGTMRVVPVPVIRIVDCLLRGARWSDAVAHHAKELLDAVKS